MVANAQADLFVGVLGIDRRLGLLSPDTLVEGLQQRPLEKRQRPLHFSATEPQSLLTLRCVPEAQRAKLPHLQVDKAQRERRMHLS